MERGQAVAFANRRLIRSVAEFLYQSPQTTGAPEIATYARQSFPEGRPVLEGAIDLMHRIHHEFIFDPAATTRRRRCRACSKNAAASARTSRICRSPACDRSAWPRAMSAATCLPIRRRGSHAWSAPTRRTPGCRCLPGSRLGRSRSDQRRHCRGSPHHPRVGPRLRRRQPLAGVLLGGAEHQLLVGVSVVPVQPDQPEAC